MARRYARQKVEPSVPVELGPTNTGSLLELGEGGLGFSADSPLVSGELLRLRFNLDPSNRLEAAGQVAWLDETGTRGGVRFVDLTEATRQQIRNWVSYQALRGSPEENVASPLSYGGQKPTVEDDYLPAYRSAIARAAHAQDEDRESQRRFRLVLAAIIGCFVLVALISGAVLALYFSRPGLIRDAFADAKRMIAEVATRYSTSEVPTATSPEASAKHHPRSLSQSASRSAAEAESSTASSASVEEPVQQPQFVVVDSQQHRWVLTPRTNVFVRVHIPTAAEDAAAPPASLPPEAAAAPAANTPAPQPTQPPQVLRSDSTDAGAPRAPASHMVLAPQGKTEGSVVLAVLVGEDGLVKETRLLSGPPPLAPAVIATVRQWHFKPYYQNGRPVEVERRIEVGFTISAQ